jgi:biopolymer transport protein ExbD
MRRLNRISKRRSQPGRGHTRLRLTSMMDILTVLLLFLLKSFVVEGEAMTPVPGVDLPESTSDTTPRASVVIAIFDDAVMIDGEVVARISKAVASNDLFIEPLADHLDAARETAIKIARRRGGSEEDFDGRVSIQGDRAIEFAILQRVMYTCSASGFEDISLAVIGTS